MRGSLNENVQSVRSSWHKKNTIETGEANLNIFPMQTCYDSTPR